MLLAFSLTPGSAFSADPGTRYTRIPIQFIAALGDPTANSGTGAQTWGIWEKDPGPRGVWLRFFGLLKATGGYAPALWKFDPDDWWLDENGLIMEKPSFPLAPGKYLVTGNREAVAELTIYPNDESGDRKWELTEGINLYDVTHLPCRSARFRPSTDGSICTPANALIPAFPITPGTAMPPVSGCRKLDYSVLFIIGLPDET